MGKYNYSSCRFPNKKLKLLTLDKQTVFYATIIRESNGVHKIKVVVPPTALTAAGVEVTASETGIDDSVFLKLMKFNIKLLMHKQMKILKHLLLLDGPERVMIIGQAKKVSNKYLMRVVLD